MKNLFSPLAIVAGIGLALSSFALAQQPAEEGPSPAEQQAAARAAQEAKTLNELLRLVEEGKRSDAEAARRREAEFLADRNTQRQKVQRAEADLRREQAESERLEGIFDANDRKLDQLTAQYRERLGQLEELFGVLQQYAGDTRGQLINSLTSAEPSRGDRVGPIEDLIAKTAEGSVLPAISEIRGLWQVMVEEVVASGEVSKFQAEVVKGGEKTEREVVRIGSFQAVSDGEFLKYVLPEGETTGVLQVLPKQPTGAVGASAASLQAAGTGAYTDFAIDPLRGQLLELLGQSPNLREQVDQGGTIGYIILALGAVAIVVTILKLIYLLLISGKMRSQMKSDTPNAGNPLGRVLQVYHDNRAVDVETLELKMDEAILKETPNIERFNAFVKIVSVVAPLMGLFGTVTGMINTFQAITLFGTGDPKVMAGGISQALVTTVLGLVVAIPTVLLHSLLATRSKSLIHILEEQSAGIIAAHAEKENVRA